MSTCLAAGDQKEETRKSVERWLRNPAEHRLPSWLRGRLALLFPLRGAPRHDESLTQKTSIAAV